MLFTLEALQAREGDCLLVHYGNLADPGLILIDGGPAGVFADSLGPRLNQLRALRVGGDDALPIRLGMVSHIDADHVVGILNLTNALVEADADQLPLPYRFARFWHNSLDAMIGQALTPESLPGRVATLAATGAPPPGLPLAPEIAAVVASVAQGRQVAGNDPFDGPVSRGARVDLGAGLRCTVLGPGQQELDDLRRKWEAEVPTGDEAAVAAYLDRTVPNLSSIVCLLELEGRQMLLTGDARGDKVIEGAREAGLLDANGQLALDLLKLPHHGSSRNVAPDFFETFPARHYVVSADGAHGNPDTETLEMLLAARPQGDDDWTLWFTNREGRGDIETRLTAFLDDRERLPREFGVEFRDEAALSLRVDLGEPFFD